MKVMIVDDHPAVREGLALRISNQTDMEVCGEAADITDAMNLLESTRPDVVVIDVQLKTGDGLDLVKRIKARDQNIRIIVWSVYPDKFYAQRALSAGALGYINKEHSTSLIVEAIRRVSEGKVYLCEEMADKLLNQAVGGNQPLKQTPIESLSDRELEIFRLIGEGLSTAHLARRLHLSRNTIDTHRQRIKEKLNLADATELTQASTRWVLQNK
ncbi:MAG: response regulator transcription factor [Pirellulales bacterium]|nr:response regulator transcription factor [Pirellulales bacterium]